MGGLPFVLPPRDVSDLREELHGPYDELRKSVLVEGGITYVVGPAECGKSHLVKTALGDAVSSQPCPDKILVDYGQPIRWSHEPKFRDPVFFQVYHTVIELIDSNLNDSPHPKIIHVR